MILSIFKFLIHKDYKFYFLHEQLNWKLDMCEGWFDWKTKYFDPSIMIAIVRNI